jgi:hypothetical protein
MPCKFIRIKATLEGTPFRHIDLGRFPARAGRLPATIGDRHRPVGDAERLKYLGIFQKLDAVLDPPCREFGQVEQLFAHFLPLYGVLRSIRLLLLNPLTIEFHQRRQLLTYGGRIGRGRQCFHAQLDIRQ